MSAIYDRVVKCLECVRAKTDFVPKVALVLGSGLGDYGNEIQVEAIVDYHDIEGFPVSTVPGHSGRFIFGYVEDVPVVCMQGRVHYYEGYAMEDVVLPVRLMKLMGAEVPICGNAGDQQAALYGQDCLLSGDLKITYGTGCFLLANTGEVPVFSRHGLVTTIAATCQNEPVQYALEGSVFIGGAVIQWLRDELRFIKDSADSEYFAQKVHDNGGVYIVPAFAGLGAPYWNMRARGVITGLTRGAGIEHIIRAALESIAYQSEDVIAAMRNDMNSDIRALKVDGGASANNLLMQFQADISHVEVVRPLQKEATAAGAALLAGKAVGFYRERNGSNQQNTVFKPAMTAQERGRLLGGWRRAVNACFISEENDNGNT